MSGFGFVPLMLGALALALLGLLWVGVRQFRPLGTPPSLRRPLPLRPAESVVPERLRPLCAFLEALLGPGHPLRTRVQLSTILAVERHASSAMGGELERTLHAMHVDVVVLSHGGGGALLALDVPGSERRSSTLGVEPGEQVQGLREHLFASAGIPYYRLPEGGLVAWRSLLERATRELGADAQKFDQLFRVVQAAAVGPGQTSVAPVAPVSAQGQNAAPPAPAAVTAPPPPQRPGPVEVLCARCGAPTVLKRAVRGPRQGQRFRVCSAAACRAIQADPGGND
ncbi:MAG: hypothetical protein H7831_11010 [Magnetococcus sp. WYHC-3]